MPAAAAVAAGAGQPPLASGPPQAPPPPVDPAPSSAVESGRAPDPHGFAPHAAGISSATQKRAKAAVVAASLSLDEGEMVTGLVCGEYLGHDGVAVLTTSRIVFANSRTFAPDVDSVPISTVQEVKGWIESNRATLEVTTATGAFVVGGIKELDAAQMLASELRGRL